MSRVSDTLSNTVSTKSEPQGWKVAQMAKCPLRKPKGSNLGKSWVWHLGAATVLRFRDTQIRRAPCHINLAKMSTLGSVTGSEELR